MTDTTANERNWPFFKALRQIAWLTLVVVGVWPVYAASGFVIYGVAGIWTAAVAGVVCLAGAAAALGLTAFFGNGKQAVNGLLGGMIFRAGIPLGFGLLMQKRVGILDEGNILGMVLAYYLFTLVVETLLSLKLIDGESGSISKAL